MAVSSLKGCWFKLSARIRDYIDVVDSYYRPTDEVDSVSTAGQLVAGNQASHRNHRCGRKDCRMNSYIHTSPSSKDKRSMGSKSSHHRHHHHHRHHQIDQNGASSGDRLLSCRDTGNLHQLSTVPEFSRKQSCPTSGYTKRKTPQGQVYFSDMDGHRYWHDPSVPKELLNASLDLDSLVGELPSNWEIKQTSNGRTYFINHTKKTTQFTDPRLVSYRDQLVNYMRRSMIARLDHRIVVETSDYNGANERSTDNGTGPVVSTLGSTRSPHRDQSRRSDVESLTSPNSSGQGRLNRSHQLASPRAQVMARNSHLDSRSRPSHGSTMNLTTRRNDVLLNATIDNRVSCNFYDNLLRGSHNNLSSSTGAGQSNTFTGPIPAWFKPHMLIGSSRKQQKTSVNSGRPIGGHDNNQIALSSNNASTTSGNNNSNIYLTTTTTTATTTNTNNNNNSNNNNNNNINDSNSHISNQTNICQSTYLKDELAPFDPYQSQHHSDLARSKELSDKISILRQELLKQQVLTHPCKIAINRERIFEESYRAICQMLPRDLKKRLIVKFRGEAGLDYGGVAREWFYLLSREILNPVHGLFQYTSDDIYNLQINPDSGIVYKEHLSYLNFCGRVIGMAVFHGHFIEGHFTLPFYKMLLGKPITLSDIEYVDPELYSSLCWILENDKTDMIDTTFLVQHNAFGQLQEHELKEGGRNIAVTEANKHEYVSLYVNYRCRRGIENQFEAFQRGFYELISPSLLENFNEHELELLIGGLSKIDVEDWRLHTKLKNCTTETALIVWFWDIVRSYGEDRRARLLQFVTGSPRVPIQGFKALQGFNSEPRLFTIHLIRNANTDDLPKSHTCFNRIDVPPYETYDKLRDKLTQAIEETMGFAMQ